MRVYAARLVIGGDTPDSFHLTEMVPAATLSPAAGKVNSTSARTISGSRIKETRDKRAVGSANSCMMNERKGEPGWLPKEKLTCHEKMVIQSVDDEV